MNTKKTSQSDSNDRVIVGDEDADHARPTRRRTATSPTASLVRHVALTRGALVPPRGTIEGDSGLVILSVEPDGPAASAGLLVGDVIVKLGNRPIEDVEDLVDALGKADVVGRTFNLDLVRGGERVNDDVLIGERPRRSA